jgi:hypothetical protein
MPWFCTIQRLASLTKSLRMAFVVDRGTVRRPLGLSADGLHARLPRW